MTESGFLQNCRQFQTPRRHLERYKAPTSNVNGSKVSDAHKCALPGQHLHGVCSAEPVRGRWFLGTDKKVTIKWPTSKKTMLKLISSLVCVSTFHTFFRISIIQGGFLLCALVFHLIDNIFVSYQTDKDFSSYAVALSRLNPTVTEVLTKRSN